MKRRGGNKRSGLKFEAPVEEEEEVMAMDMGPEEDNDHMDEDDEDDEDDEEHAAEMGEEFESEWEFFPIGQHDWHAAKALVVQLLDNRAWDAGSLASLITETAQSVGSCIKLGDQTTQALGLGLVLSLADHAAACPGLAAVRAFALERFQGAQRDQVSAILAGRTGLLINERVLNLPPLVALHLHLSLFDEMQAAGPTYTNLTHLLFVTLAYRESRGDKSAASGGKKARDSETQLEWFRPEEELYARHAAATVMWPVAVQDQASRWTFDGRIAQFKVVMLIPTSAIPAIAARMRTILDGDYGDQ